MKNENLQRLQHIFLHQNQELFEFITPSGEPGVKELAAGVYSFHFHAERTSGNSTVDAIYVELWKYEVSTAETLLGTSELTSEIVESKETYSIHISIGSEITIASRRCDFKFS